MVPDPRTERCRSGGRRRDDTELANDGTITISGKTYSFEDISRLVVRLQLIPALSDVQLTQASEEAGSADAGTR